MEQQTFAHVAFEQECDQYGFLDGMSVREHGLASRLAGASRADRCVRRCIMVYSAVAEKLLIHIDVAVDLESDLDISHGNWADENVYKVCCLCRSDDDTAIRGDEMFHRIRWEGASAARVGFIC